MKHDNSKIKNKTIILTLTDKEKDTMYMKWLSKGYKAGIYFKHVPKFLRAIRRLWVNYNFPFIGIWVPNEIKEEIKRNETVILHMGDWTRRLPRYFHSINKNIRIIGWYWNKVNKRSDPSKITDPNIELWTFNPIDASKYNMKLNIQYYDSSFVVKSEIIYDVYFIGHDNGRFDKITDVINLLQDSGLNCKVDLLKNSDPLIPYSNVCERISRSQSILEINQKGQDGLTLRALESLYFEKKLITNNKSIKNIKFYCKKNIFIIGEDDFSNIKDFINEPYDTTVNKYKSNYSIDKWFNNFFE